MGRSIRMILLGLAGAGGVITLLLLPDLLLIPAGYVPLKLRRWWAEGLAIALLAAITAIRWLVRAWPGAGDRAGRIAKLDRVDRRMDRAWEAGLAAAVGLACVGFLATWVPHYLTWPWSRDEDTFCVLALSWDRGILPYRDIRAFNFPGAIYLFWGLGKAFGWGRTVPFYALDAGCVVLLGVLLAAWSRRTLGGALPGLVGYLAFLVSYLSMTFERTGQRDWHAAFLVCSGLLAAQAWPGRRSRIASALTTALALSIRPHVVLFLPALAAAIAVPGPAPGSAPSRRARVVLEWSAWLGVFLALAFSPLIACGIVDDLVRNLRVTAYGGPFSRATPAGAIRTFLGQFRDWRTTAPLVATLLLAASPAGRLARVARPWALAWLGAAVYRPLHPVDRGYLVHPLLLVTSISWALAVSWIATVRGPSWPVRAVAIALLAYELVPVPPWMCSPVASVLAVRDLAAGELPQKPPLGCLQPFPDRDLTPSSWDAYRDVLRYLRRSTGPGTYVANVLNRYPYESLNGPAGRLSPFRTESGLCWLSWVDMDLDGEFARELRDATDSVVVWEPRQDRVDPAMRLERVIEVIRGDYEPEARFGKVEVWRRKPRGSPP